MGGCVAFCDRRNHTVKKVEVSQFRLRGNYSALKKPMATPRPSPLHLDGRGSRRQGQTKNQYQGASLHGGRFQQDRKRKSPSPEDICAPPIDSSDDESMTEKSEGPKDLESKRNSIMKEQTMPPNSEGASVSTFHNSRQRRLNRLTPETNISISSQNRSQKRSSEELDDMNDVWSQTTSKKLKTGTKHTTVKYGSSQKTTLNIHDAPVHPVSGDTKGRRQNSGDEKQARKGFKIPPGSRIKNQGDWLHVMDEGPSTDIMLASSSGSGKKTKTPTFKAPPASKQSTSSSAAGSRKTVEPRVHPTFNAPKGISPKKASPRGSEPEPAFKSYGAPSRTTRSSESSRKALMFADPNTSRPDSQYHDSLHAVVDKLGIDSIENADSTMSSSVTAFTQPTSYFASGSSGSELSTPPDSPTKARCPLCKGLVDRDWFEEMTGCRRLTVKQQYGFCRAHKIASAHNDWRQRGYPDIDWPHFDERLTAYHPAIDHLLQGTKPSFYRNALEDTLKAGKDRTLKQSMLRGHDLEGFSPGYYGSRGAKMMVDNIIARFSPKLRRLGGSDKIISTAGVSGYVQAVLASELAILLVMDDMKTDEDGAREVLRESVEIGNLLNEEEDDDVVRRDMTPESVDVVDILA